MNKHKLYSKTTTPDSAGHADAALNADDIIEVAFHGRITGEVVEALIQNVARLSRELRTAHKPVHILIDITGTKGHTMAARLAAKHAARLDFDKGAAYGGNMALGLVMQYLQHSISAERAHYFRTRRQALGWLKADTTYIRPRHTAIQPLIILAVLAFLAVIGATYGSWRSSRNEIARESQTALTHQTALSVAALQTHLDAYVNALYGFRGLYNASVSVERNQFRAYFNTLNLQTNYPGFGAISYVENVTASQKASYITRVRQDKTLQPQGYPTFQIFPAATKPSYYALTYTEPSGSSNIGFDLASDPARLKTLNTARDSGTYAATGTIQLINPTPGTPSTGFLITLPIYTAHTIPTTPAERAQKLLGFVNAVFSYQGLFGEVLSQDHLKDLAVSVRDSGGQTVYASKPLPTNGQIITQPFTVGGQHFSLVFEAASSYGLTTTTEDFPHIIIYSGILVALLLFVVLGSLLRSRSQAIRLASTITEDLEQERNLAVANEHKLEQAETELQREKDTVERQVALRTRQLTETQARLTASINNLTLGFIMLDRDHKITSINPAALQLFKRILDPQKPSLEDLQVAMKEGIDFTAVIDECLTKGRPKEFKEIVFHDHFLHILISPINLDTANVQNQLGVVILFEDVTEERVMARSKDEFFSIASHELRTPLTAIRGNAALIQMYYPETSKDHQLSEMITDIHDSSVRLIEIVNDFLDASRLEQGKMQFNIEAFSIEAVIEKVVYELGGVVKEKGFYLKMTNDLKTLPLVWADKNRVKQVIYNLVGNAVKFVEHGGVTIDAQVKGKLIKVDVIDTGKGISPENQQILFHKFQQATTSLITRDTTRGTGLGLYISRLLMEKMGGRVSLDHSQEGKGSTFSFTIPIATDSQKASKPSPR